MYCQIFINKLNAKVLEFYLVCNIALSSSYYIHFVKIYLSRLNKKKRSEPKTLKSFNCNSIVLVHRDEICHELMKYNVIM